MPEKDSLAQNTVMLYLLTGSNYFFGLVTVPYLTRVLGAQVYGAVGFASSCAAILQTILDFGFQLSAVIDVANSQDDKTRLERIVSSVTIAKLILIAMCLVVVGLGCAFVPRFRSDSLLYLLYFLYAALNALIPDFFYRGMERMTTVTMRNVTVKTVFTVGVLLLVRSPNQYLLVPLCYACGALAGLAVVFVHMRKTMGIWFVRVSLSEVVDQFKRSALFFVSRAAGNIYSSLNTVVLGILYPLGPIVGYYSACNTAITAGRQAITPITGSLFPYIVRTKNFRLLGKAILFGEVLLIGGCAIVGIYAEPLCSLVFGEEFSGAAPMLRIMLPLIPITLATYLCGWAGLGALGRDIITNLSVVYGGVFQLFALAACWCLGILNQYVVCCITVVTEILVLAIRGVALAHGLRELEGRTE